MISLKIRFLTGKYHATAWGRNVNEGMIDWPPSPWRIFRALVHSWKIHHSNMDEKKVSTILELLLHSNTSFRLPKGVQSHTRHYYPLAKNKTEKVFDSFVMVDETDFLGVRWDVILTEDQIDTLEKIVNSIGYLGRAESWCEIQLTTRDEFEINCNQIKNIKIDDGEVVDVMIPTSESTVSDLYTKVSQILKNGVQYPQNSKLVSYVRPMGCLTTIKRSDKPLKAVSVIRYAIVSNVKPRITESVMVGDAIKRTVMSTYGAQNEGKVSKNLSGKNESHTPLKGHHHAFFLPTDEDGDLFLDHVTVISSEPFSQEEIDALGQINSVWSKHFRFRLIYQAKGMQDDFKNVLILKGSKRWVSLTPYVLNRHVKVRGSKNNKKIVDGPEDQLRREIKARFNQVVKDIKITNGKSKMKSGLLPVEFKRWRKNNLVGFGAYNVELEFENELYGPLSLGHGSHFGLGLFMPST